MIFKLLSSITIRLQPNIFVLTRINYSFQQNRWWNK